MRNNALMFFGGIATAAVLQFATQRDWRANPASEVRADEVAYAPNDDAEGISSRAEDNHATRGRRRVRTSRARQRTGDFARREERSDEDRSAGWNEDRGNDERMIERRERGDRDRRDQGGWRCAADERPVRDTDGRDREDRREMRHDRGLDRDVAWQSGPRGPESRRPEGRGRRPGWDRGPRSGGDEWNESSHDFGPHRFGSHGFGPHSGMGRMSDSVDGVEFVSHRSHRGHGDEHFGRGRGSEFVSHRHHRGHRHHGWAGGGWRHESGGRGWASHRRHGGRHHHHGGHHRHGRGGSFARHSMRGHQEFGHHGFGRHESGHRGFARHSFSRQGWGGHGLSRHHSGGRSFAMHGRGQGRGNWGPGERSRMGRRGMARMAMHHSEARLDALFAAADTNKDGKLTKEELGAFIWKRFAKPDAQSVTKEELKSFAKERISALRAERPMGRRHRAHSGPAKPETKPGAAQPKPQPKAEPKAAAKPAAATGTATTQTSAPVKAAVKPAAPTQPVASKPVSVNAPTNKPAGVSKAEAGSSPAPAPKITGPKIGTLTTSGDVKAALFAARR
jgi:hypothetical protein